MTRALAAYHDATYGGVYTSTNLDFTNPLAVPTWTRLATTGLANTLVKVMQVDAYDPYNKIYVQLDNDDIYRWNGSSWTKILDLATARTLASSGSGTLGYIAANKTIAGRLYISITNSGSRQLLYSGDYGANWTVSTIISYVALTGDSYLSAAGDNVWLCYGHLYRSMQYSDDNAATWKGDYSWWNNTGGGDQLNINPVDGTKAYYYQDSSDYDLARASYAGGYARAELQDGKNLGTPYGSSAPDAAGCHYISKVTSGLEKTVFSGYMFATVNAWTGLVEASPTLWSLTVVSSIDCAREDETKTLLGIGNVGAGNPRIYGWVGPDTSDTPWNMSGANYAAAPYTDSFPSEGNNYVPVYGIFVGEGPASVGVYVYADEQGDITSLPSYSGLGIPMFGDRSAFRDMYADGFDIYHAQDVHAATPQIHNPWPATSGYAPVSDGAKYVATDIATQAELNTHAGLPTHHAAVTLDADAAVLLDLSTQEIGLDTQTANTIFAGPTTGAANEPTFRAVVAADLGSGTADATKYLRGDLAWSSFDIVLDYIHEHAVNEDLSGLCDGSRTVFILANEYAPETTAIYLNGVRQLIVTDYTEDAGYDQVTFSTAPIAGDILIADYILAGAL